MAGTAVVPTAPVRVAITSMAQWKQVYGQLDSMLAYYSWVLSNFAAFTSTSPINRISKAQFAEAAAALRAIIPVLQAGYNTTLRADAQYWAMQDMRNAQMWTNR